MSERWLNFGQGVRRAMPLGIQRERGGIRNTPIGAQRINVVAWAELLGARRGRSIRPCKRGNA